MTTAAIPSDRYEAFCIGFGLGASDKTLVLTIDGHELEPDYRRGYDAGRSARNAVLATYATEIGYDLSAAILREGGTA